MRRLVVLDTNCLIQILPLASPYHKIWSNFMAGKFSLCVSNEILSEYTEILGQFMSPTVAQNVVSAIVQHPCTIQSDPHFKLLLITADPDDNKFVDCAFAAGADYIVTEDSHFNEVKQCQFPRIEIKDIDEFMKDNL